MVFLGHYYRGPCLEVLKVTLATDPILKLPTAKTYSRGESATIILEDLSKIQSLLI